MDTAEVVRLALDSALAQVGSGPWWSPLLVAGWVAWIAGLAWMIREDPASVVLS